LKKITIAVDAMGGDHGPSVVVPAVVQALASHPSLHLILVGDREVLYAQLSLQQKADHPRLVIHHASQQVEMDESPAHALRTKKDSSMRVAINLVKQGVANACVSAGNTGALMATARFVLKTIAGIDRPAIVSAFPTMTNKNVRMLDLGANVDSTAEHLFQFAVMGSVLASATDNIVNPEVCLLNIGAEDIKGNELVKETAQLLNNSTMLNYRGYIEGDEIFLGKADVIVCDGFVGNVALKTSEGVISFIGKLIKAAYKRNILTKLVGLLSLPILKSATKRIDPNRYNGATLIGLQGIVIKSHGSANKVAFANAIEQAILQVEKNVPERIGSEVERLLKLSKQNDNSPPTHS
jgi:glycerol-3-phosphate acyltransferase PlsX